MSVAATSRIAAADGSRRFWDGRPPCPVLLPHSSRRLAAGTAAASLLAHGVLLLAIMLRDLPAGLPGQTREILVEVVPEPPAPGKRAGETGAPGKSAALEEATLEAKRAAIPILLKRAPGAAADDLRNGIINSAIANKKGEAEPAARGIVRRAGRAGGRQRAGASLAPPFDSGPDRFRAAAVPLPAESGGEAMSYRRIVGGMLERVKQYPSHALQLGAKGIATVGFVLDQSGRAASVVLLRSSGDADLDAEGVALVKRAAPFPPPPSAPQTFAIEVAFGLGK